MRLTSSSRSGSRTRLGLEELELRWQPAGLGIGLSIAALQVPVDLPVVSAVAQSGLIGSTGVNSGTHASTSPSLTTPTPAASAVGNSNSAPATIKIQETFFSIEQSASSRPVIVASTVTIIISQSTATPSENSAVGSAHSALTTSMSTPGSSVLVSSFRPVAVSSPAGVNTTIGANPFVSVASTPFVALNFGAPNAAAGNSRFTTTETTLLRTSGLGQDNGTNTAPPAVMQELNILQSAWIGSPADAGTDESGVSKPAQPPADAKKEPAAAQPQMPAEPEIPLAVQIPLMADPAPQVVAGEDVLSMTDLVGASAGVIPTVEEDGLSYRTWAGIAAAAVAIAAGYPLHRWYQQFRRTRPALLVESGRI